MIATMIYQCMKDASLEELKNAGLIGQYVQHDHAVFPTDVNGVPFSASYIETTGDWKSDLESNMAAEQRARTTYEHLMSLTNDPDILAPLAFLRQREVVHYNRFKELKEYYENIYKK